MKEQRLLKAMGKVDGKYIEEASPAQQTKKPGWLKWGAMAACLCLIIAAVFAIPHMPTSTPGDSQQMDAGNPSLDGDPSGYGQSKDLAPMVCVNHALYQIAGNQPDMDDKEDEFIYLGEIISKVDSSQKPTEDFQANDEIIGAKVYLYDGENVVVEINGQYWLYELLYEYLQ